MSEKGKLDWGHPAMTGAFDDLLEEDLTYGLKNEIKDDRHRTISKLEELAGRLAPKVYDNSHLEPERVMQELKVTGAWDFLRGHWEGVCYRTQDSERMYGKTPELHARRLEMMRGAPVEKLALEKFLHAYGLVDRKINRASHKQFLPDGSWISNGVRFGP